MNADLQGLNPRERALKQLKCPVHNVLRQSAHEGGKVVSPTHRPPLLQELFFVLISVRG